MLVVLMMLQAVSGPPVPHELRKPAARVATPCPETEDGGDIVVCARLNDQRLPPLPDPVRKAPEDRMTFRLPGGGSGNVHAIQTALPGAIGQGVAATFRIPLGRKDAADTVGEP